MMTKEGSTKIVNFMTPGAGVHVLGHGYVVKMQYFSSSCLLWDMDQIRDYGSYAKAWPYKSW